MTRELLDTLPLSGVYLITILLALLAAEIGYQLGRSWLNRHPDEPVGNLGEIVGTTFGLLAFLLALLMTIGLNRYDARRGLIVQEANAIGTAYLRAGYLEEPYSGEVRDLLRDYADQRLLAADASSREGALARSSEIQLELWTRAEALARANPQDVMLGLFISSLNDMIDLQSSRIASFNARIPEAIWVSIYVVGFLAFMLIGFENAHHGKRNLTALLVLVLILGAVLLLTTDLDRPLQGYLRASQQPLIDVQTFMKTYP